MTSDPLRGRLSRERHLQRTESRQTPSRAARRPHSHPQSPTERHDMTPGDDTAHPVHGQTARKWTTRPEYWLTVASAIGWVTCLVRWPRPTLYGAAALGAGTVLLCGLRALLGERAGRERGDQLPGAGTSGSEKCTGCVACGGPDCISRPEPDGAQTDPGADSAPSRTPDADVEQLDGEQLRDAIRDVPRAAANDLAITAWGRANERANAAERKARDNLAAQREAEAVTEIWRANTELAVGQRDQARDAIARVRAIKKAPGRSAVNHYANIQDDAWDEALDEVRAALDGPAPEQPVSDPQPVDDSDPGTCQVVHLDGGPVRVTGSGDMDDTDRLYLNEILTAAKRKHAAEHPPEPDVSPATVTAPLNWPATSTFRRLAAGLTGTVRDPAGQPIGKPEGGNT